MNNFYIFTKGLFQIFLYLLEIIGITYLLTYLSSFYCSIDSTYTFIQRMIDYYVVYQLLTIVILGNLNDIKKDSLLTYKTIIKLCIEYCKDKKSDVKKLILNEANKQLDTGILNDKEFRNAYINILDNIDNLNLTVLNIELINAEHRFDSYSLKWKYSFLLRLLKQRCKQIHL